MEQLATKRHNNRIPLIILGLLLVAASLLLGQDAFPFLRWWIMSLIFSLAFYPVGAVLFSCFGDKGWFFSRTLGIALGGYLTWLMVTSGLFRFRVSTCFVFTVIPALFCWALFLRLGRADQKQLPDLSLILQGEVLFLLAFFFWTWCAGFRPEVTGTEKPMDYGFMAAMMRSDVLPARDMWYGEGVLNYYYGGQYYAVYLTKLTFTGIKESYHLMMSLVAAVSFILPWSLLRQTLSDRGMKRYGAFTGGLFGGASVSLAGNLHYLLYGLFGSLFRLSGYEDYWFPSSTRYIGHNPVTDDQCIHEFPSYSFVLGDLHAHVVNLFIVLTFIGLMYAWYRSSQEKKTLKEVLLQPPVLAAGFLIGLCQWTNYWDFIIYYTVFLFTAVCIAFCNRERGSRKWLAEVAAEMLLVFLLYHLVSYPFTSNFDSMFKGVGLAAHHTAPYQLAVLWGLPVAVSVLLAVFVVRRDIHSVDLFWVMLSVCGLGLILLPELVFVRDIYGDGYARSNTMFKLTYQAFVMLGMVMPYAFFRILWEKREGLADKALQACTAVCSLLLFLTFGYTGYAVTCWFGNVWKPSGYIGLDSTAFLEEDYPENAGAIRYIEENIIGQPIILEAPGDSYSDHCMVSALTGVPTVAGWYVHEWLWRDDPDDLTLKQVDIEQIYTCEDPEYVSRLLQEYQVSYIFIGKSEREEYGEYLNEPLLRSMGTVLYDGETEGIPGGACLIRVNE